VEERKNQTESGGKREPNRKWMKEITKQKVEERKNQAESGGKKKLLLLRLFIRAKSSSYIFKHFYIHYTTVLEKSGHPLDKKMNEKSARTLHNHFTE